MTNEDIGNLFIVGFHGTTPSAEILKLIHEYHIAGVILFSRNIESPRQVWKLTQALQLEAKKAGYIQPLLIGVDQENGVVRRLSSGFTKFPGAMAIAATGKIENASKVYSYSAQELKAVGINWNFAPVADVNTNALNPVIGVRSFGDTPPVVAQYVRSAIDGIQSEGICSSVKHFPGHGDTETDSHIGLPILNKSLSDLESGELIPFIAGIQSGVASIMVSHIVFSQLDEVFPSSLSRNIMTDLLRQKLSFEGVIVTDDLEMDAIKENFGTVSAAIKALQNGADLAMISHHYDMQRAALEKAKKAVDDGELDREIIEKKISRIAEIRKKYCNWNTEFDITEFSNMRTTHTTVSENIYQQGITVVRNDRSLDKSDKVTVINLDNSVVGGAVDRSVIKREIEEVFRRHFKLVNFFDLEDVSSFPKGDKTEKEIILIVNNLKGHTDDRLTVIKHLLEEGDHISILLSRNPYDVDFLPANVNNIIALYELGEQTLEIALKVLVENEKVGGKMPVRLG